MYRVLKSTGRGNLLLAGPSQPVDRPVVLSLGGRQVARIFETIGRVEKPFFLATPLVEPKGLVGKDLS